MSAKNIAVIADGAVEEWVYGLQSRVAAFFERPLTCPRCCMTIMNQLLHLYDALLHYELYDMWARHAQDRDAFLEYLKTYVGMSSTADRQHFINALARAKRLGTYESAPPPAKL